MPFGVSSSRDNAKRVGFGSSGKLARRFRSQVDEPRKQRACLSSRSRRNLALFRHYRLPRRASGAPTVITNCARLRYFARYLLTYMN